MTGAHVPCSIQVTSPASDAAQSTATAPCGQESSRWKLDRRIDSQLRFRCFYGSCKPSSKTCSTKSALQHTPNLPHLTTGLCRNLAMSMCRRERTCSLRCAIRLPTRLQYLRQLPRGFLQPSPRERISLVHHLRDMLPRLLSRLLTILRVLHARSRVKSVAPKTANGQKQCMTILAR